MASTDTSTAESPTKLQLRHAVRSDVGRHRTENQDSYAYVRTPGGSLFVVADGMGGARGGATASALAVDIVAKEALDESGLIDEESLRSAIEKANSIIFERSRADDKLTGMGTTIVALALADDKALIAHVGDSRIYLLRDNELSRLTRDHTLVQELIDSGAISPEQAENHPIAHMLTRSLGPVGAVDVETKVMTQPIQEGDKFLLCCDGLYNLVEDREIEECLRTQDPEGAALYLVQLANDRGGTDNITVEVVEVFSGDVAEIPAEPGEVEYVFSSSIDDLNGIVEPPASAPQDESIELSEEQVVDEAEALLEDEHRVDLSAAYNSVIFGSSPTSEDIRKHQERVKKVLTPEQEIEELEPELVEGKSVEEEDVDVSIPPPGNIQRMQIGVLGVIVLALVVAVYAVLPNRTPQLTASQGGGSVASQEVSANAVSSVTASVEASTTTPPLVSEGTPEHEAVARQELVKELEEQLASEGTTISEEQSATSAGAGQASSIEMAAAQPEGSGTAWPVADIVPEGTVLLRDQETAPIAPERAGTLEREEQLTQLGVESSANLTSETAASSASAPDENTTLSHVIAQASDLTVPPPPRVAPPETEVAVNQPIVWEHERIQLAKVEKQLEKGTGTSPPGTKVGKLQISESEMGKVVAEKLELREKIANVDAKLQGFSILDADEAKRRVGEIEDQLELINDGLKQTSENLETAKRRLGVWLERKKELAVKDPKDMAGEVAISSIQVKRKKESFEIASLRYLDAVELWRENPGNDSSAAQMASYGKELEARRSELTEAVKNAVESSLKQAQFDVTEFSLVKEDLERRRDRLNRHAGFAKAFAPISSKARMERQRALLNEREKYADRLKELREQVSDSEEIDYRRKEVLRELP